MTPTEASSGFQAECCI